MQTSLPSSTLSRTTASNIDFINLNSTNQAIATRTNYSKSQFVQQEPYCFAPAKSQDILKAKCADALFLANYLPYYTKPQPQRDSCILINGICCYREFILTLTTSIQLSISDSYSFMTATRAMNSFWPAQSFSIK